MVAIAKVSVTERGSNLVRNLQFVLLAVLAAAFLGVFVACGDDEESLSLQDYFAKMTEINTDSEGQFEEVFGGDAESAKAFGESFDEVAADLEGQYSDVEAPDDVKDEHDEMVAAIKAFRSALRDVIEGFEDDAPPEDFEAAFGEELADVDERVSKSFCALQAIADDKGIEAQVGCEDDAGGEEPDPGTLNPVETNAVLIEDFNFDPPHIQVKAGDTVTWTQGADGAPHTATADDDAFDSGSLSDEGDTFEFTFEEAGEYPYHCKIHPEMLGLVTVVE